MDIRIENLSYFCFRKIRRSLRMIMGMKKLLSLPPNLVDCFHAIEHVSTEEWFCTSDPVGARLGSGGGTTWLLEASRRKEAPDVSVEEWLGQEKRILLHAGGQSRRLPGYAPSGKILTPIPVFRWARGQRLSQNLLSLQLPLYERIMKKAPESPAPFSYRDIFPERLYFLASGAAAAAGASVMPSSFFTAGAMSVREASSK